jgi:hypothetical protein
VYTNKINEAKTLLNQNQFLDFEPFKRYQNALNTQTKKKSAGLAGLLSAVVPGLGKVYSKDWKDGIIAFVFTGTMMLQSVRNFNRKGFDNPRGYIYGAIGTGFYLGNIYGSVKSAKNFNIKETEKIKHEISDIFNAQY